jgi:hypothetical protein
MNRRPAAPPDRVVTALDPLVRDGTLPPSVADRVYQAVTAGLPPEEADDGRVPASPPGWHESRLLAGVAGLGTGLILAAFGICLLLADWNDFSWKVFLALVGVVAGSAAAGAACWLLLAGRRHRLWLAGVFGSVALLTAAATIVVEWETEAAVYSGGALMVAGGVAGYRWLRSHPATLVAAFGGLLILAQLLTDLIGDGVGDGDITTTGFAFMCYGVAVAGAGWRFACRHTTGLAGGAVALVSLFVTIWVLMLVPAFDFDAPPGRRFDDVRGDIRMMMLLGVLIAVALVVAYALTGHVGFLVEAFVGAAVLPFFGVVSSTAIHPLRWAFAFGLLGAISVAVAVVLLRQRGEPIAAGGSRATAPSTYPGPPPPPHLGPGETVSW